MATIRELFHTIANWHNKITVIAGCTKETLKEKSLDTLTKEELKAKQKELLEVLEKLEASAVTADEKIAELKDIIGKKIDLKKEGFEA